jgi:hypothetical protein
VQERQTALTDGSIGIALVILAVILWRAGNASFQKGMSYPPIIAGIFLIYASTGYAYFVEKRSASLVSEYAKKPAEESRALEEARMTKVVGNGYTHAFGICTLLIVSGVGIFLFYHRIPIKKGVACGLVMIGILGLATEGFSKHKNQQYLRTVQLHVSIQRRGRNR